MSSNKLVFNNEDSPLYIYGLDNPKNPITISSLGTSFANVGKFFTITTGSRVVSILGGFLVLEIKNPANSGKTLYVSSIQGGATNFIVLDIFKNASIGSGSPSPITPQNTNYAYSNTSSIGARYLVSTVGDPTSGGVLLNSTIQAGGSFVIDFNGEIVIPSAAFDQFIYLRLTTSVATSNASIGMSWWLI